MDKLISEYIRQDKCITNKYPNIYAQGVSKNILSSEFICPNIIEYIQISDYLSKTLDSLECNSFQKK